MSGSLSPLKLRAKFMREKCEMMGMMKKENGGFFFYVFHSLLFNQITQLAVVEVCTLTQEKKHEKLSTLRMVIEVNRIRNSKSSFVPSKIMFFYCHFQKIK